MSSTTSFRETLIKLHRLREKVALQSHITPEDWLFYADLVASLCKVHQCYILKFDAEQNLSIVTQQHDAANPVDRFVQSAEFTVFTARANEKGYATRHGNPLSAFPLGMALLCGFSEDPFYLLLIIPEDAHSRMQDILLRAQLLLDFNANAASSSANIPSSISLMSENPDAVTLTQSPQTAILQLLDLLNDVYQSEHFLTAAYAIVNGIVSHNQQIDQVVLGWREDAYIRVKAISHYERFEKKTDTVRLFEAALEEAADQYTDILFNADTQATYTDLITLAHKQLQVHLASQSILTFPLKDEQGETYMVITLISYAEAPSKQACEAIHFVTQTALPKLKELYLTDASMLTRTKVLVARTLSKWVGPDNLLVKSLTLTVSLLLIASLVFSTMHRVDGKGQFVTDNTRIISAPFDGIVSDVVFSSGDSVAAGDLVLTLDTQDLMLQLAELQAELQRTLAEANRARAEFASIDLEIANARAAQVNARIGRINFQLAQAQLFAPFDGIVVEGERRELLSAPVSAGQPLMRIAEIADLYVLIRISHEDIHFIEPGSRGFFSLVSQPDQRIPILITHVVPMANVSPGGAEFSVMAQLETDALEWWRPGMTGVAKLDVESRSYLWVFTHKAVNRIRLALWW